MSLLVNIEKNLPDFSLRVKFEAENEVMAFLGASGSGKSMTLRCIAGIERPDRGRIILDGEVLYDSEKRICLSPQQRRVGYLFQNYALFPHMTVEENIATGIHERKKSTRDALVADAIVRFFLQGLERRLPGQLSGGQQQRVALARMFAAQPKILLLDEPFSAMDTWLRWQLEQELSDVLQQFSGTTIFVSHNRNEAYRLCGRIGVICEGKLERLEEKWTLFRAPQTVDACLLTGCKNIATAEPLPDGSLHAKEWGITLHGQCAADKNVGHVGIRAHYFQPTAQETGENIIPVEVCRVIEDTFSIVVMVRPLTVPVTGRENLIRWELSKEEWKKWEGSRFSLYVIPENVILLK